MVADILIAVLLCALTILMGYLGVHVTLHPTEEPRKQRRFKIGFWLCGITAIVLIAVQTARNTRAQSALQTQLSKIQKNTEQPPNVQVTNTVPPAQVIIQQQQPKNIPLRKKEALYNNDLRILRFERSPYEPGKPVFINAYLKYDGENPARVRGYYKVVVVHMKEGDATPEKLAGVENDLWSQMIKGMSTPDHGMMINPKSPFWVTLSGPIITAEQVDELQTSNSGAVLFLGQFRWVDGVGDYELDYCALVQANPEVFITCPDHNGPVRMKK